MIFKWITASDAAMQDACKIRTEVFIREQGFENEYDHIDQTALHVVGYTEQGEPVCTARLFSEQEGVYHAGRIAVVKKRRGTGVGREMLDEIARKAKEIGAMCIELGAQFDKAGFYEAVGYERCGEEYLDENYPHIPMRLQLL